MNRHSLRVILCSTGNQCSCFNAGLHDHATTTSSQLEPLHSSHAVQAEWMTLADESTVSCSSQVTIKRILKPAVEQYFADKLANLANSAKLVVTGADYFGDMGRHRQLTDKVDAEIKNRLHKMDHCGASIQHWIKNEFLQHLATLLPF